MFVTWASCGNSVLNSWKKTGNGFAALKMIPGTPKDKRDVYRLEKRSSYERLMEE